MKKRRNPTAVPLTSEQRQFLNTFFDENSRYFHYVYCRFSSDLANEGDIIQESMLRIMQHIDTFMTLDAGQQKKYIVSVIKNLCIDAARENHKLAASPLDEDALEQEVSANDDIYLTIDLLAQALSDSEWQLLKGLYLDGKSKEEMAAIMHCNAASLRMQASRARKKARQIIESQQKKEERV